MSPTIPFVCTANTCRSPIVEAIPTSKAHGHEHVILILVMERSHKEAYRAEPPGLIVSIDRLSGMAGGAQ
jgi:predicted protein tyrosine phosphatase